VIAELPAGRAEIPERSGSDCAVGGQIHLTKVQHTAFRGPPVPVIEGQYADVD
jgi:hypothetical protein